MLFDYVIVGGGTAGITIASRLSAALPEFSFLLLEAGPDGDPRLEPTQGYRAGLDKNIEWDHKSVPQKGLDGKVVGQIQGKVMGGSSAINVQGWTRGAAVDFDQWAKQVGDGRWSWSGQLPYFNKSETYFPAKSNTADLTKLHGKDGPIKVAQVSNSGRPRHYPLREMVSQCYDSAGVKWIPDGNAGDPIGYCEGAHNTYDGKRNYAANCYKLGENVTTYHHALAESLVFEGKKVIGVQFCRKDHLGEFERFVVNARKEVLVCSGVQGSAKLLLLSGIGPLAELKKHNIPQICDLPVGENYSDHPVFQTFWKVRDRGLSLGDMPMVTPECDWTGGLPGEWMAWHNHADVLQKTGGQGVEPSIYDLVAAKGKPNTESFVLYGHIDLSPSGEPNPGGSCLTIANVLVSPTSRGTLTLASSNPLDAPVLDPNILSNELDNQLLYACGQLTISMMQSAPARKYGTQEYGIDESIRSDISDVAMRKRVLYTSRTLNHGSGTCAMGSVVDTECRVKGLKGVRVVDASIFPAPLGAHYQAAVYALAEQMAQRIIDEQAA
ncbi:related to choline dehydrogenase and related flavoproteins [Phialocephala subalpina]|uniref:Related to choline dehydrogenase and related flavoproteins n=1 Tax=Phialocephala subalpina TaxID=576137 RepID=A0A1L7XPJ5_9HELO|nr:related to choline dehydrogenase and related flavoproteins [Phialocephala subalpina]